MNTTIAFHPLISKMRNLAFKKYKYLSNLTLE